MSEHVLPDVELTDEVRQQLLANFVLGLEVKLPQETKETEQPTED